MCLFNTRLKNLQQKYKTRSTYFINVGYRDSTVGIYINFLKYSVSKRKHVMNNYMSNPVGNWQKSVCLP